MSEMQTVEQPRDEVGQVKVGDIFYESWGYDQTNIDFAKVVGLSPTGKTATCQMMSETEVEGSQGFMCETVVPKDVYGQTFKLRVKADMQGQPMLVGTYPFVEGHGRLGYFWKWDGKPLYQSHYA